MSNEVNKMADYKKMYHILFNKITDITAELQEVQRQVEEIYIDSEEKIVELNKVCGDSVQKS